MGGHIFHHFFRPISARNGNLQFRCSIPSGARRNISLCSAHRQTGNFPFPFYPANPERLRNRTAIFVLSLHSPPEHDAPMIRPPSPFQHSGRIFIFNGASSSGKTSLCKALLSLLPAGSVLLSVDDFLDANGMGGMHLIHAVRKIGPELVRSFHETVFRASLHAPFVLVDHVIGESPDWPDELRRQCGEAKLLLVKVACDRGRTGPAGNMPARPESGCLPLPCGSTRSIHEGLFYDLEIDTTRLSPQPGGGPAGSTRRPYSFNNNGMNDFSHGGNLKSLAADARAPRTRHSGLQRQPETGRPPGIHHVRPVARHERRHALPFSGHAGTEGKSRLALRSVSGMLRLRKRGQRADSCPPLRPEPETCRHSGTCLFRIPTGLPASRSGN